MRTNYNDSSRNGGRFPKRQNSGGKGGSGGGSNNGRRPQGRRPGSHSGGGTINASGASAARNKYLELAKDALANGNRVEAENYYQHAEHYSKILNAAMENRREREDHHAESHRRHHNTQAQEQKQDEVVTASTEPLIQQTESQEPQAIQE